MIQAGDIIHFTVIVETPVGVTKTTISPIHHIIFFFKLTENSHSKLSR